jgi:cytochrome c oxidase cbb3-type subunit 2
MNHDKIEKNIGLMGVLVAIVISFAGIIEIVPLMTQASVVEPIKNLKPYTALQLSGFNTYVQEGCYGCHSQQIRPFVDETIRYGHYSVAGESVYDRPHQWGSKRTGPDLARVGGRYSDEWHKLHLIDPRSVVPTSNMPGYPWLANQPIDAAEIKQSMKVLKMLGHPYTDEEIESSTTEVYGESKLSGLIAYLQYLGTAMPRSQQ